MAEISEDEMGSGFHRTAQDIAGSVDLSGCAYLNHSTRPRNIDMQLRVCFQGPWGGPEDLMGVLV